MLRVADAQRNPLVEDILSVPLVGPSDVARDLAASVRRALAVNDWLASERKALTAVASPAGPRPGAGLVEEGWLGIGVPEELGGSGGTFEDSMAVVAECARVLAMPQHLGWLRATAALMGLSGQASRDLLTGQLSGDLSLAVLGDWFPRHQGKSPKVARLRGGVSISGRWTHNLDAADADVLILAAPERGVLKVFSVDRGAPGLSVHRLPGVCGGRTLDEVQMLDVQATALTEVDATETWREALERCGIALAVEQVSAAGTLVERTLEFLQLREQFGAPLAAQQSLQHRMADMSTELEAAKAAVRLAVRSVPSEPGSPSSPACQQLRSAVAVAASASFRRVAAECLHLHGALGFTWEHDAHLYFRRAAMDWELLGDPAWHRSLLARRSGWTRN